MSQKSVFLAAAAVSVLVAPLAAQAETNPAVPLSIGKSVRTGSTTVSANKGAGTGILVSLIVAVAAAGAGYLVIDKVIKDQQDDDPDSN